MSTCSIPWTVTATAYARSMLWLVDAALTESILVAEVVSLPARHAQELSAFRCGVSGARVYDAGSAHDGLSDVCSC